MAKKSNKTNITPAQATQQPVTKVTEEKVIKMPGIPAWLYEFKIQAIIVGILAFVFYINTIQNENAHDDTMVIIQNEYSLEGFAGIPDILTKDAYDSYYKQFNSANQLSGGRYRPLSIVTFAIEQQFFGPVRKEAMDTFLNHAVALGQQDPQKIKQAKEMHIRHFISVLWFVASMVIFLYFLRYIVFRGNPIMALLAAVIFTIHPIHTEVVANVKSRDEIMSLLFICLTFIYAFRYLESKNTKMLIWGMVCYFLAFLSKEYAISLMLLLPLSFVFFGKKTIGESITATIPYVGVTILYVIIRLSIVGKVTEGADSEILNNPYAFATPSEKLATEISTCLNYLKLLIFPHPLSADYSYNTIPYVDFSNIMVWVSLAIHLGIISLGFYFFKVFTTKDPNVNIAGMQMNNDRRKQTAAILCFAIAFYMLHFLMICNIVFDIGATMGERLIYHSSVGFSIALAFLLYKGMEKIKPEKAGFGVLAVFMTIIIVLSGYKTIDRNKDWKNDETLFAHDINVVPNSALVNANVAAGMIDNASFEKEESKKQALLYKGIEHLDKALAIHPTYVAAYLNRALAYFKLALPDKEIENLDKVRSMFPNHPKLPEMYFNVGVMYYMNKQYPQAINAWQITVKLKPEFKEAQNALAVMRQQGLLR